MSWESTRAERERTKRLEHQLYEHRGEWAVCKTCPLRLVCYMKRELVEVRWCIKCDGWVLDNVKVVIRCAGFRVKSFDSHQKAAQRSDNGSCPNCNRLHDLFDTYKHIRRTISTTQGDPEYLAKKYPPLDFANEKS